MPINNKTVLYESSSSESRKNTIRDIALSTYRKTPDNTRVLIFRPQLSGTRPNWFIIKDAERWYWSALEASHLVPAKRR
jgi:hypothetical protein